MMFGELVLQDSALGRSSSTEATSLRAPQRDKGHTFDPAIGRVVRDADRSLPITGQEGSQRPTEGCGNEGPNRKPQQQIRDLGWSQAVVADDSACPDYSCNERHVQQAVLE
jgi:hypothetical protein